MMKSGFTYRPILAVLAFFCLMTLVSAQDIENIKKEDLFKYSGGIAVTNTFYHSIGAPSQRDPYFWQVNANMNLTFLDIINAPFSFTISQQNRNFSQPQPFNRFGISPTYKAWTVHLGHRTLTFSDFTLAGNLFFGIGVEFKPEHHPLRVSAMYGRFAKPVDKFSQEGQIYAVPTYKRIGYGLKVGFETRDHHAAAMFFKSADDVNSISLEDSTSIDYNPTPEENLVMGLEAGFKLLERVKVQGEYAYSLFTRDTRIPELLINDYSFVNNLAGLFTPNASSLFTNAFKGEVVYSGEMFQTNLRYRRVDPGYTTHGSSFLNNDLEDITLGVTIPLLRNKVNLSANGGAQKNNLENQNAAELRRFIFSTSANITASEKLMLGLNYSNFSTSTRQVLIRTDILSDTLEFFQVTRSAMVTANYQLSQKNKSALFLTGNFQDASDNQGNGSNFQSANAGYSFALGKTLQFTTSMSFNQSKSAEFTNTTYGPIIGASRPFFKNKVRSNVSLSLLNSHLNGDLDSNINNVRWSTTYQPGKRHSLALNTFYIYKTTQREDGNTIQEIRVTVNYSFRI